MAQLSVLMCSEGTYPFHPGGVSVWCDQIVHGMPEVDFKLFAITHTPDAPLVFSLPQNVTRVSSVALWGTDEPGFQKRSFSEMFRRKSRTTSDVLAKEFLNPFRQMTECLVQGGGKPRQLGEALMRLHLYFKKYDFAKTMTSPQAWNVYLDICRAQFRDDRELSIYDATTCMRWMQRFLGILAMAIPDAGLTHASMAGLAAVPGVINKCLAGAPFIVTEHGIYIREIYLSLMRSGYSEPCRRFLLAFNQAIVEMNYFYADIITALGSFNKGWQMRLGATPEKIRITPNGVDPECFATGTRIGNSRPVVITLARIYYLKGIDYLLKAAVDVRKRIPNVLFRILGDVADQKYFDQCWAYVEANHLQETVEFSTTDNAARELGTADLFCLPSVSEGMPFSILEAMFSGCPVVATDVGNVAELLSGTGIVVPPADSASLSRALLSMLEGEGAVDYRKSLARAARNRAHSMYTIAQSVDRFRNLYNALVYDRTSFKVHSAAV